VDVDRRGVAVGLEAEATDRTAAAADTDAATSRTAADVERAVGAHDGGRDEPDCAPAASAAGVVAAAAVAASRVDRARYGDGPRRGDEDRAAAATAARARGAQPRAAASATRATDQGKQLGVAVRRSGCSGGRDHGARRCEARARARTAAAGFVVGLNAPSAPVLPLLNVCACARPVVAANAPHRAIATVVR